MAKQTNYSLQLTRLTRTVYFFIAIFALSIIIFDSGNLITREAVIQRWAILSLVFVANTIAWYFAAKPPNKKNTAIKSLHYTLIMLLSVVLLVFAGFMTYWERGMASTSTIFYALPLLSIGILKSRHALLAMAALAAGTYSFAAVKYFNDFFNEGFRVQLWGSLLLYIGTIFVIAWLIMILTNLRHDSQ